MKNGRVSLDKDHARNLLLLQPRLFVVEVGEEVTERVEGNENGDGLCRVFGRNQFLLQSSGAVIFESVLCGGDVLVQVDGSYPKSIVEDTVRIWPA